MTGTVSSSTMLHRILAEKRRDVARRKGRISPGTMRARADEARLGPAEAGRFRAALTGGDQVAVIAEVKRRSPSKGPLALGVDPVALAQAYVRGGATAVSVLTDAPFFAGSGDDLRRVTEASAAPVLCKDFVIDAYQVDEARTWGADAVLLIVTALNDDDLRRLLERIRTLGMDALVEVHTKAELERALAAGARLIGVNNRDLHTFRTTLDVSLRLARHIPPETAWVSESGICRREDVRQLAEAGAAAILVGETFVVSGDPEGAVRSLASVPAVRGAAPTRGKERA